MEYKKVEKCTRRDEPRQSNILLKERIEKCNLSKISESKILSIIECTNTANIETKRELKINREELKLNGGNKILQISSEGIRDSNFEYEEEWDIGGIPELLSELDADIENSLKTIQTSKYEDVKIPINNKQELLQTLQQKHCEEDKKSRNVSTETNASLELALVENDFEKSISKSKFTGFSKGGHLISKSINSFSHCSTFCRNIGQQFKQTKKLRKQSCSVSMSSQAGNNGNTGIIVSGTINSACSQNSSGSNSGIKPNNKMSIDHQATLDKGLKMKIKRTKPGSKSSEAKHEIVKASEQHQNGLVGTGNNVCSTTQEDLSSLMTNQSGSSNSQNSNAGASNSQGSANSSSNKKNMGGGNNQNITSSNNGNISINNAVSITNSASQPLSQGTKRGSSGHRRDKIKEKSSHSNRTAIEKSSTATTDKESTEKCFCHCNSAESNVSTCCNNSCNRKTENNTRLPAKNICGSISVVPPGVFTPSSDTPTSAAVSNLLAVTSAISTSIITQTVSSCVNSNTPGPPSKDTSTSNVSNVKISSHIAAQLAAAAASNNPTSASSLSSSSFINADIKLSSSSGQPQIVKQLSPCHPISTPATSKKTLPVSSAAGIEKLISIPNIKTENSESPPPKRAKQNDNDSTALAINKEMVDICIGTSVGTITEPDCLGPCEPGTSVTLEGIVWHETEGGVLVVNVTWRGKTYVGTLLDCTRHDWAPPRFCDSPTEDLDARTPKGRGKRNRATTTPDLSNFTETRSSIYFSHSHVHSKLRNGSNKGGRATSRTTTGVTPLDKSCSGSSLSSGNNGLTPSSSPTAFLPPRAEKRKSKDESPPPVSSDNEVVGNSSINPGNTSISSSFNAVVSQPQSLINPVTGLNVQLSSKKCKNSSSSCAVSPVLLECPENDCSKKYKHVNGLRYHQSHAHGSTSLLDEDSMAETEGHITPQPSPLPSTPPPSFTSNSCDLIPNNQAAISSQPTAPPISEESNKNKMSDEANMCQQLETGDKNFATENVSSSSCEDLSTSTISSSVISSLPSSTESAPILKASNEQQKQPADMTDNSNLSTNNVFSFESNNQAILQNPTAKSGVLRYGQTESKNNKGSCSIPQTSPNEVTLQSESIELDSSKKCLNDNQGLNNAFCTEPADNKIDLNQNQHSIVPNKTSSENSTATKCKKERNLLNDYESDKTNACNIVSREDVQSPAYSDISDDSTPINELDHIDKQDSSKNSNLVKKSQNLELNPSADCPSSQPNISSPLNSYGVYQFYQQQQFLVPPPVEQSQQQSAKSTLNSATISPSLAQHQSVPEFNSKKDQLDILSKANLNQPPPTQHTQEINKDSNRTIYISGGQSDSELSNAASNGANTLNTATPSKPVSHFYAFNYMPTNYSYNVDHNFGSDSTMTGSEDMMKANRQSDLTSPNEQSQQQHSADLYKDDHSKEGLSSSDAVNKSSSHQISSKQLVKSDAMVKTDFIKQESLCNQMTQIPQHMQVQGKDHQGIGVYTNMYQRHPLTLASQQLSRDEELRRYYIFSDQQRRQNASSHNVINQQMQSMPGNLLCKEDSPSSQQHPVHNQSQMKIKGNMPLNINKSAISNTSKDSPKHKHEEEIKVIKQEGQKPTMETQGPPPPPTSQYFLHPSFLTSAPFGFDPSHPMYRNVLMPATSPYNTPSYHLPMPRFHAPEDLSRNTGTKALDALHHAASQYYTTHKIHELSERALKSPSNSNTTNAPGTIKISNSSPNIVSTQQPNIVSHSSQNQSSGVTQIPHNLASQTLNIANKLDVPVQKPIGSVPGVTGTTPNESQKSQATINTPVASSCGSGNGNNNSCTTINGGTGSDSRSPPPQRHVHTHHHTHVGLGYPMYPAPYGAAVLASQQAAAVAVINPFPAGPNK